MKKTFKILSSALVACALIVGNCFSAFAAESLTVSPDHITVTENAGHGDLISSKATVAPDEYAGKQEVYDEVYPNGSTASKDLFRGGGLSYENQWSFATRYGYIVKEVDSNGNETGRYVFESSSMIPESSYGSKIIEGKTPVYTLIASGERGYSQITIQKVIYQYETVDGVQVLKRDENGKPLYTLGATSKQHVSQMVLWGADGNPYYAYSAASEDEALVASLITGYETVKPLSASEQFGGNKNVQDHVRGIALHGYWGAAEGKVGSLSKFKAEMKAAVNNGLALELLGSSDKDAILAAIDNMTEGDVLTATQAALWSVVRGTEAEIDGTQDSVITGFTSDANGYVSLAYHYLLTVTEKEQNVTLSVDKESFKVNVGNKTDGIYDAELNFRLSFVPSAKDELKVTIHYTDANGNEQTITEVLGAANDDGSYPLTGLKVKEDQELTLKLTVEGTHYIDNTPYVFTATHTNNMSEAGVIGARHSTLIGVGEVAKKVDLTVSATLTIDVAPETEDPSEPEDGVGDEDSYVDIPDNMDVPLGGTPEGVPDTGDTSAVMVSFIGAMAATAAMAVLILNKKRIISD